MQTLETPSATQSCPSCGGAGGGPFGRLGGAWDTEDYVCPRCQGSGQVVVAVVATRPSIVKTTPASADERAKKKRAL